MNMFVGPLSVHLGELIDRYQEKFRNDPTDGFSLFETELDHDGLVARLERAIAEGKPYNPQTEEWSPQFRKQVESGEILI